MTTEYEEWRDIPSLPGYEASSLGRIRHGGKILPGTPHGKYRRVCLRSRKAPRKNLLVHRLVCEAFHGPPPAGLDCAHGDGDCSNNRPQNLRWATHRDNLRDQWKNDAHAYGEKLRRGSAKDAIVLEIFSRGRSGASVKELASEYGYSEDWVSKILNGRTWSRVTGAKRARPRKRKPITPAELFERWHLESLAQRKTYRPSIANISATLLRRRHAIASLIGAQR